MREAPVAYSLRVLLRSHQGSFVAPAQEKHSKERQDEDKKAEGRTTKVSKAGREGADKHPKAGSSPLVTQVRDHTRHVGLHMRNVQQTHSNMVLRMWRALLILPILFQATAQAPKVAAQQVSMEEARQSTGIQGEPTHPFWQEGPMGTHHPSQGYVHDDSCTQFSIDEGQERREGKRQEGGCPGSRRDEAARACTDGSRSARRAERPTQEVDQGRTRNHPWRCKEDEEIQGVCKPKGGRAADNGSEVEGIQSCSKEELGAAERALPDRKKDVGGTAKRGEAKAGRTPERSQGEGGKDRADRGGRRIRQGVPGRRGPGSPTLGRRRGRTRRGFRRRRDDSRRLGQWEKIEIATSLWRRGKEKPEEIKRGRSNEEEWPLRLKEKATRIQEAPTFQLADSWGIGEEAPLFQGYDSNPGMYPVGEMYDPIIPESESREKFRDYDKTRAKVRAQRTWRPRKHEESRELEELRFMVRQAEREEEAERREEADIQFRFIGGEDLGLELMGLLAQGQETIPIWVYVLSSVHEETIFTRPSTARTGNPHDVIAHVIQEVRTRLRFQGHLELIYITPQPPPAWRWGEDALHLIADIQPWRGGSPILLVDTFGDGASEDNPVMGAHRCLEPITCNGILRLYGRLGRCNEWQVECFCHHKFLDKGIRQTLHADKGDRVDLRIRARREEEEEEDEFAFMQGEATRSEGGMSEEPEDVCMVARNLRRLRVQTAYAYFVDESEPRFFVGESLDKQEYRWFIWETLRDSPSSRGKSYEVYIVRPNPPDLESKTIQGYIVEERGVRSQSQTVILMDVEFLANQDITVEGNRIFTESWRSVERVHEKQTRNEFLKELQLSQFCRKTGTCILQMGGKPWREQDPDTWWLMEGTYGLLRILNQKPEIPVSCQTRWAQENLELEEFEEKWKEEEQEKKRRRREEREEEDDISWLQTEVRQKDGSMIGGGKKKNEVRELRKQDDEADKEKEIRCKGNYEEPHAGKYPLQVTRPSVAKLGMDKLPPPGNGKVTFNPKIKVFEEGKEKQVKDKTWENPYTEGMCRGMGSRGGNPFIKRFKEGMKYEEIEEEETKGGEEGDEEETTLGEEGNKTNLPLIEEEEAREQVRGPLPLVRKEEEERPIDEEEQERQGDKGKYPIRLEEVIGNYKSWDQGEEHELAQLQEFANWFNTHHVIPDFDRSKIRWKEDSWDWVGIPTWSHSKALELHYYTDGSVKGTQGGSASILFVKDEEGWKLGGFLQNSQKQDQDGRISAHMMELDALIMTMKWCHDVVKLQIQDFNSRPKIHIHFDAKAAGFGATGEYDGNIEEPKYVVVRAIEQALEIGMGAEITPHHVKGHSGNPGNEAADTLAEEAIRRGHQEGFWRGLEEAGWPLQWLWWLYRGDRHDAV